MYCRTAHSRFGDVFLGIEVRSMSRLWPILFGFSIVSFTTPFFFSSSLSLVRIDRSLQVKRLSEEKPTDGTESDKSTAAEHAEHGDGRETSPRPSWSQEDEEGGGKEEGGEKKEEAPPSSTDKLREGIRAALSSIVPYKSQWPHVCMPRASADRVAFLFCFVFYVDPQPPA